MTDETMTTIHREETDQEIEGVRETEATADGVETEAGIIAQDVMTLVKEITDVEMSLQNRRNANEMTADLGHRAETLAMHRGR
jgi:hypothetical protein